MNLYERIIIELFKQKISFLIIGSYARLWNYKKGVFPKDLDIWINPIFFGRIHSLNGDDVVLNEDCVVEIQDGILKLNIFIKVHGLNFESSLKQSCKKVLKDNVILHYINENDCLTNLMKVKELWDF